MEHVSGEVQSLVDHLFRREAGRMVAALAGLFGPDNLELAEDVVQDALVKALDSWPFRGIPDQPVGWLHTVARNKAVDVARRRTRFRDLEPEIGRSFDALRAANEPKAESVDAIGDDQLKLMFVCCHPAVPQPARIALTLKTLGGFGVGEIARAFLTSEPTMSQRLVRAKRRIRDAGLTFEMPGTDVLAARRDSVLDCLYLMFNEGYSASHGTDLVRADICRESLRLATLLAANAHTASPDADALVALMAFQAARLSARTDGAGELLTLANQDRGLWDRHLISVGFAALRRAMTASELSSYHLQAGIASAHAAAPDYESTDWRLIRGHYNALLKMRWSPIVALNRAVATAMLEGPQAGLNELDQLSRAKELRGYHLLPATRGEFHLRLDETESAKRCFAHALELATTDPERRYLTRRIAACRDDRETHTRTAMRP